MLQMEVLILKTRQKKFLKKLLKQKEKEAIWEILKIMTQKFSFVFVFLSFFAFSQVEEKKLDELIQNTLKTFDVPGMSVGVIKDGKIIYAKGFGVRSLTTKQPMDENTLVNGQMV